MAGVVLSDVSKTFGTTVVLEDLSLDVADGEFMVLVGPSGCGKSTALRIIAGLEEPTSGTIAIGGRVVNDLPPRDRDVAMVFQSYALYPHMTVRENLAFGPRLRGLSRPETERLVTEAASVLGLGELLDRRPRALSGGQGQRVALGRALVRKPMVFLFDEPLSNLDARLRVSMRAEILRLQRSLGTTAIYVTHDQVEAMTMGSRIAVLRNGRLQQVGAPLELYERPANVFVAGFVGSPPMSFLRAALADGGGRLAGAGFSLPVPEALRPFAAGRDGLEVVVGLRPEDVHEPRPSAGPSAPLRGRVELVEALGHEALGHVRVGGELVVSRLAAHGAPRPGEDVTLACDVDALHLFDAASERRLGA